MIDACATCNRERCICGEERSPYLDEDGNFRCTRCGACCRSLKHMKRVNRQTPPLAALVGYLDRGDGVCRYLNNENDFCEIYETRPDICRASKWPATPEYLAEWCERLEKEAYGEETWEEQYGKKDQQQGQGSEGGEVPGPADQSRTD